jgi:hypothetical protein
MPFASTAGLESCQNAEGVFENGNQAERARDPVASTLCPVVAAVRRLTLLILRLADGTISNPDVHLSRH